MPTIYRSGPYRFFFYSGDRDEPFHVHVEREDKTAKFWLDPVRLSYSSGLKRVELSRILTIVQEQKEMFMEAWNEYFGC